MAKVAGWGGQWTLKADASRDTCKENHMRFEYSTLLLKAKLQKSSKLHKRRWLKIFGTVKTVIKARTASDMWWGKWIFMMAPDSYAKSSYKFDCRTSLLSMYRLIMFSGFKTSGLSFSSSFIVRSTHFSYSGFVMLNARLFQACYFMSRF